MVSAAYYREQARLMFEWASRSDAATAEKLRKRAQEYEILSHALDAPSPSPPPDMIQPVAQQQEQVQPKPNDDKPEE